MVICVSLRMAASAEAPSAPMPLSATLQSEGQDGNGERVGVSMGADTNANTVRSWFERQAAYLSDCSVELPLRTFAIAAPPSGPIRLHSRLRGWGSEVRGAACQWELTQK